jgi:hypothetical protein
LKKGPAVSLFDNVARSVAVALSENYKGSDTRQLPTAKCRGVGAR